MASIFGYLLALLSVAGSAGVMYSMHLNSTKWLSNHAYSCLNETFPITVPGVLNGTHVPGLSNFFCVITPVFKEPLTTDEGRFLMHVLFAQAFGFLFLAAVESSRKYATWFVKWLGITVALAQALGISVVLPLLWIPTYILSSHSKNVKASPAISHYRLTAIAFLLSLIMLPTISMLMADKNKKSLQDIGIVAFNIMPVIFPFLWSLTPAFSKTRRDNKAVINLHYFAAGMNAFWYIIALSNYFIINGKQPQDLFNFAPLWSTKASTAESHTFMLIDLAGFQLALMLFAAYESGIVAMLRFTVESVLLSPGVAVCLYSARREERMAQGIVVRLKGE